MAGSPFTRLLRIVGNERSSPALLPYEGDIVQEIQTVVSMQKSRVQALQDQMVSLSDIDRKLSQAMELELLRWNYVLRVYHATRFRKIQTLIGQMLTPVTERLSGPERVFAESLSRAVEVALPGSACEFTEDPDDMSAFVFFQATEDLGPTLLSSSATAEAVPLARSQIYFARLEHIKHLLDAGQVILL
jgi:hypothetical protein